MRGGAERVVQEQKHALMHEQEQRACQLAAQRTDDHGCGCSHAFAFALGGGGGGGEGDALRRAVGAGEGGGMYEAL